MADKMWTQFRRLLLGTIVEELMEAQIPVDTSRLTMDFHEESAFRVPRINNYMRFKGEVTAQIEGLRPDQVSKLERGLRGVWPELLSVVDIPIGDRLDSDRNQVRVSFDGSVLHIGFDLIAD